MVTGTSPTSSSAALGSPAAPSLELREARQARDGLATLLRREHVAMAEFLLALANFDRRRGWEVLGHSSLFSFLHVELKLPNPSAYWRMSAARLLQRFPDLAEPLRQGRLCCTATAELAKVLTAENQTAVLPRFFGLSAREAQEVVAELQPRQAPATRTLVTGLARAAGTPSVTAAEAPLPPAEAPAVTLHSFVVPPSQLRTSEVDFGGCAQTTRPRDDIEPLTAELRRLHMTVSRQFLAKLDAARHGLSHSIPHATAEQVVEAALDLLLEKQARARGLVKKPRSKIPTVTSPATPTATPTATATATLTVAPTLDFTEPLHRREGPREHIPAATRRAVWDRDRKRCSWPLDGGGVCGSTDRLELDHVVPWAHFSEPTVDNLRVLCHAHNMLAARQAFGARCVERYAPRDGALDEPSVHTPTMSP